ncbi:MAG: O-antigen ligase family protein [Anaerolineae bacterium]
MQTSRTRFTPWLSLLLAVLLGLVALVFAALFFRAFTRAHAPTGIEAQPRPAPLQLGANVALLRRADTEIAAQLDQARAAGLQWIRQPVEWAAVEPTPGAYDWAALDRVVDSAAERGLGVVLTLAGAPAWARKPLDQGAPGALPADPATYARFVTQVMNRYRGRVAAVQVWDSPNLATGPNREHVQPRQYVALLKAAYEAAKAADPGVIVLGGGLAPTTENTPSNQDDVRYLETLYRAGAGQYFDALAIKPYGFWSGPDDRRVDANVLNFSRAVLLRDIMARYGDASKPAWAVEWGWNALPSDWQGRPAASGSDTDAVQAPREGEAVLRARSEWPWLAAMIVTHLRPDAPPDDPIWGFSMLDDRLEARPLLTSIEGAAEASVPPPAPTPNPLPFYLTLAGLALGAVVAGAGALLLARRAPWAALWAALDAAVGKLGDAGAMAAIAASALLFTLLPWPLNAVFLLPLTILVAARLDLALAAVVVATPFFLRTISLGPLQVSLVETLALLAFALWALRRLTQNGLAALKAQLPLNLQDGAVLVLLLLGGLSGLWALLPGVATREFRVVILEPILFYIVLRDARLDRRQILRLADAAVLAGALLTLYGFATYTGSGSVAAEGVRRLKSVYGSPNNLALMLGRILPILLALALWGESRRRRLAYVLAAVPIVAGLFMTFSTGAWLLGVPAALLVLGAGRSRRAFFAMLGAIGLAALALIPFARTERVARLVNVGEAATWERRQLLWQATLNMIRDHPWLGVGLDNFLYEYRDAYYLPGAEVERNLSHPHNILLDFWSRLGIVAVVALVGSLVAFFRGAWRLFRRLTGDIRWLVLGLAASMVYCLAHGLIDNSFFLVDLAFFYMLTVGIVRMLERQGEA